MHLASASWVPASDDSRWVSSLVDPHATTALSKAADRELLGALSNWGRVALGAVTGANGYFALTRERARVLDIDEDELVRISPPGSSHLQRVHLHPSAVSKARGVGYNRCCSSVRRHRQALPLADIYEVGHARA